MATKKFILTNQDPWEKIDDDVAGSILARLPVVDYFHSQIVCKRWRKIIRSQSFQEAAKELFNRLPWFFMSNFQFPSNVVYDLEVECWRHIRLPIPRTIGISTPLAASNSLMCCVAGRSTLYVCNPITGSARNLNMSAEVVNFKAVTMRMRMCVQQLSYSVYVVSWSQAGLCMHMFSLESGWSEFGLKLFTLAEKPIQGNKLIAVDMSDYEDLIEPVHESNLNAIPVKEVSGVTTVDSSGELVVYYLERSGFLIACYTNQKIAVAYPRIIAPVRGRCYTYDLAECNGRILYLLLTEENGGEMLRVWEFSHEDRKWYNIATMPPEMSALYNRVYPELDCAGCGDYIMICVSSTDYDFTKVALYNMKDGTWKMLPVCLGPSCGHPKRFVTALPFMPNIQDIP